MAEFWESSFAEKQEMWGMTPVDSARTALEFFKKNGIRKILIPGYGYGRNGKLFIDNGLNVTGIEISETAIKLSQKHYGTTTKVYHGSVSEMPFDQDHYDGIYCYSLIHLLDEHERGKFIQDCYNQLSPNGYMIFIAISKEDPRYGQGEEISKDTFDMHYGLKLFFYDSNSIESEFGQFGLISAKEITENTINSQGSFLLKFWEIICKKS